ncbi:hypothetical protein AB0J85_01390 [Micromonospora echinofusca]|uniref:hypothetical protein n=1 Tax=Micromonospora echinofusca TaxID=47858 RepID=UPI003434A54B
MVHPPVLASDLAAAKRLARALGFLPDVDRGETTVSEADAQFVRYRVFCDSLLDNGRRCGRPADHDGPCVPPERP